MEIAIQALTAAAAIGGIAIAILLHYNRQTTAIWVTFTTVVAFALIVCLYWQASVWNKQKVPPPEIIKPQPKKQLLIFPNMNFRITDSLYDEKEKAKSGEIVYEGLITLPFSEVLELDYLMLKVQFPMAIKSYVIKDQRGVESPRVTMGPVVLSTSSLAKKDIVSNFQLDIEVERVKPGAFFRFLVTTEFLPDRRINNPIRYKGYYNWMQEENRQKKELSGSFSPQTEKAEPLTIDKWNSMGKTLASLSSGPGSLVSWIGNRYWYVRNNLFIEIFPRFESRDFGLYIFRDKDNVLKCEIRTPSHGLVTLAHADFDIEQLLKYEKHPFHIFTVTWSKSEIAFYVDGELVDQHLTNEQNIK